MSLPTLSLLTCTFYGGGFVIVYEGGYPFGGVYDSARGDNIVDIMLAGKF